MTAAMFYTRWMHPFYCENCTIDFCFIFPFLLCFKVCIFIYFILLIFSFYFCTHKNFNPIIYLKYSLNSCVLKIKYKVLLDLFEAACTFKLLIWRVCGALYLLLTYSVPFHSQAQQWSSLNSVVLCALILPDWCYGLLCYYEILLFLASHRAPSLE